MIVKRHTRPNPSQQIKGGIADKPMPIDVSNVMILTAGGVPTRIGYKVESMGGKIRRTRVARKGGETLEKR
jgi:large subunit ribosomal protein L24